MKIERINNYHDERFCQEVLNQHGAFLVDCKYPCQFKIISDSEAVLYYHDLQKIDEIIDEFMFYSGHIHIFYDENGRLIKKKPSRKIFECFIDEIQPSQFYVDKDKISAVSSFIHKEEDIIIPICRLEGQYIALDGHTRLYYAYMKGYQKIKVYFDEYGDYVKEFVREAHHRNIYKIQEMKLLDHDDYEIKWNQFCDDFFKK